MKFHFLNHHKLHSGLNKAYFVFKEHNIVLVRVGRVPDLPGVKLKCIRGKHDLGHVIKKK